MIFWLLYKFLGQPFRDIDLAIAFHKLNIRVEKSKNQELTAGKTLIFEQHLDCCFYVKLFLYQRTPKFLRRLFGFKWNKKS